MNEEERAHFLFQTPPEFTGIQLLVDSIRQGTTGVPDPAHLSTDIYV